MSEPEVIDRPRGRRWALGCAGAVVAVLALLAGQYAYFSYEASRRLREVMDALDQKDPRWRLADIEADREQIPDAENAALVVMASRAKLPTAGWPLEDLDLPGKGVQPPHRLREKTLARVREELAKYPDALAEARRLADFERGRYTLEYSPDILSTPIEHLQGGRAVAWLLTADAADRCEKGDLDGALRSARAAGVCGRAIGDSPFAVTQLIRLANFEVAARSVERTLGQGEASEAELTAVQQLWRKEEPVNLARIMLRGERACQHETVKHLRATGGIGMQITWLRHEQVHLLEVMTRSVEATELPPHEQAARLREVENELQGQTGILVGLLMPAVSKLAGAAHRHQASVRSLIVLVAVERYRKANGKWPEKVSELVPAYLTEVPLDPYDGKPIRLRRTPFGVVIYCIGPDRTDDGGQINREKPLEPGTDWGYQLWDVAKRRQPAPPPLPDPEPSM